MDWVEDSLLDATKELFGFSKADVDQIIANSLAITEKSELVAYFEGFLGLEESLKFVEEWENRKAREAIKQNLIVNGVWKFN